MPVLRVLGFRERTFCASQLFPCMVPDSSDSSCLLYFQDINFFPAAVRSPLRYMVAQGASRHWYWHILLWFTGRLVGGNSGPTDYISRIYWSWRRRSDDRRADDRQRYCTSKRKGQVSGYIGKLAILLQKWVLIIAQGSVVAIANGIGPIIGGALASQSSDSWYVQKHRYKS